MGTRDLVLPSLGCTTSEQKVKTESSTTMQGRLPSLPARGLSNSAAPHRHHRSGLPYLFPLSTLSSSKPVCPETLLLLSLG